VHFFLENKIHLFLTFKVTDIPAFAGGMIVVITTPIPGGRKTKRYNSLHQLLGSTHF
jgi:hypothetical protein